ncbi:WD repeat domain-containing protein 83-like isoform X2 [Sycon ciliatum]|uniref:WD repeat domain-containing protein 83-like isoform X2 n=1 Tax=Sycon ciliatum TaxID=27933 RepID=UPI0031F6A65C
MALDLPCHLACQLEGHQGAIRSVRFNVSGEYCLSGGSDKSLRLWNPHTGFPIKSYIGHGQEVLDAVSSVGNTHIGSCGADKLVIYWDVSTGEAVRKYRSHTGRVNCVQFNSEGTILISGSYDSSVRIFDCKSRRFEPVQVLTEAQDSISCLAVSEHEILVGSVDCRVRIYDIRMGQLHSDCMPESVTSVSFTRDGQCVLVSSLDSTMRLVDKATGQVLCSYTGHKNSKYSIDNCLSAKDTHVISGSEDGRICFWDLVEASPTRECTPSDRINSSTDTGPQVAMVPDSQVAMVPDSSFMKATGGLSDPSYVTSSHAAAVHGGMGNEQDVLDDGDEDTEMDDVLTDLRSHTVRQQQRRRRRRRRAKVLNTAVTTTTTTTAAAAVTPSTDSASSAVRRLSYPVKYPATSAAATDYPECVCAAEDTPTQTDCCPSDNDRDDTPGCPSCYLVMSRRNSQL